MSTVEPIVRPVLWFRWVVGADGLAHAVLEDEPRCTSLSDDYLAVCGYAVTADRYPVPSQGCCADCVARLPRDARPRPAPPAGTTGRSAP